MNATNEVSCFLTVLNSFVANLKLFHIICGVFGNLPNDTERQRLIQSLRFLCKTGGYTIWTRDLAVDGDRSLATVRELLQESEFEEVSFKMTSVGNIGSRHSSLSRSIIGSTQGRAAIRVFQSTQHQGCLTTALSDRTTSFCFCNIT